MEGLLVVFLAWRAENKKGSLSTSFEGALWDSNP